MPPQNLTRESLDLIVFQLQVSHLWPFFKWVLGWLAVPLRRECLRLLCAFRVERNIPSNFGLSLTLYESASDLLLGRLS